MTIISMIQTISQLIGLVTVAAGGNNVTEFPRLIMYSSQLKTSTPLGKKKLVFQLCEYAKKKQDSK